MFGRVRCTTGPVMNITKENFEESFDEVRAAIQTSHFIALDAEFTGVKIAGVRYVHVCSSPAEGAAMPFPLPADDCGALLW